MIATAAAAHSPSRTLEVLAATRNFAGVPQAALAALVGAARWREVAAGETLFRVGDPACPCVYIHYSGVLRLQRPEGETREVPVGDFVALANYLDGQPHLSTALAQTRVRVLEVPAEALRRLEQEQPALFDAINRVIAHKLRERAPGAGTVSGALAQPVSRVMKSPLAGCGPDMDLATAYRTLRERHVGSLVVTAADGRLIGLLSFAGLAGALIEAGARPHESIMRAACERPYTIPPDTPLWRAEAMQRATGAKYLIVAEEGRPLGMVSQSDILRALAREPTALALRIPEAESLDDLAAIRRAIVEAANEAREAHHLPSAAVRQLSETHLEIQRRAVELVLAGMETPPPCPFAFLVMGSGGRKEMMLDPDQDNGLILDDPREGEDGTDRQAWFGAFAERLNEALHRVGYVLCPGDIMARNPLYRKTLGRWQAQIDHILDHPTPKAARWCNVVLDFQTLYGEDRLTTALRRHLLAGLGERPRLLRLMTEDDAEGRPAIGLFNQLITTVKDDQGARIDLKRNGLRILADAARILALGNGIAATATRDRLTALVRIGKLSEEFSASAREAHETLLDLLLSHQIDLARNGRPLDKRVDPAALGEQDRARLRVAMRAVKRLQDYLRHEYEVDLF